MTVALEVIVVIVDNVDNEIDEGVDSRNDEAFIEDVTLLILLHFFHCSLPSDIEERFRSEHTSDIVK